jgi:glycerol-3-phosphate acyltransferase PlsX
MQTVCLAVDVHGGDYGPGVIIKGALEALKQCKKPVVIHLCGDGDIIHNEVDKLKGTTSLKDGYLIIEQCPQKISADDVPARVWKNKKESSIVRCIALQKEGVVNASLSAGDTRILIGAAMFLLGRSKNVARPALAAFLPTTLLRQSLVLDVGANLDCRAEHLVSFGIMGYEYVKQFFGIENPSVALLNIGAETSKGTKCIIEAAKILAVKCRGYSGFIEGGRVLAGDADVVVCDGFAGNVLLKACESFHLLTETVLNSDPKLVEILKKKMSILNVENYGAIPLLGLQGIVFKAHGSSSSRAIAQALVTAVKAVEQRVFI